MCKDLGTRIVIHFSETLFITAENWTQSKYATVEQNLNQFYGKQTTLKKINTFEDNGRMLPIC